jgi:hypothetical protein
MKNNYVWSSTGLSEWADGMLQPHRDWCAWVLPKVMGLRMIGASALYFFFAFCITVTVIWK